MLHGQDNTKAHEQSKYCSGDGIGPWSDALERRTTITFTPFACSWSIRGAVILTAAGPAAAIVIVFATLTISATLTAAEAAPVKTAWTIGSSSITTATGFGAIGTEAFTTTATSKERAHETAQQRPDGPHKLNQE
jgi:hypothetical protein